MPPPAAAAAAAAATATRKAAAAMAAAAPAKVSSGVKNVKPSGLTKPVPVSAVLKKFLGGQAEASRGDSIKKIWEHIKLNKLQDPSNKRYILCDEKLKNVLGGKERVGFLEVAGLLSAHFPKKSS